MIDTVTEVTWTQMIKATGMTEAELTELVRYGALVPRDPDASTWTFESHWLMVARKASRIRHDFELDAHGVSVVLSFLDRIHDLEEELRRLRARLG
jgi:chaperone modulatory protein CbpM